MRRGSLRSRQSTPTTFIGRSCWGVSRLAADFPSATARRVRALRAPPPPPPATPFPPIPPRSFPVREPPQPGNPADVVVGQCGRPHTFGDLGAVLSRHEHLVAHPGRQLTGIEVVEPAVTLEAHGHHHAHAGTVRRPHP